MLTYLGLVKVAEEFVVLLFLVQRPSQRASRSERERRSQVAGVDGTIAAVNIAALAGIHITHVSFIHRGQLRLLWLWFTLQNRGLTAIKHNVLEISEVKNGFLARYTLLHALIVGIAARSRFRTRYYSHFLKRKRVRGFELELLSLLTRDKQKHRHLLRLSLSRLAALRCDHLFRRANVWMWVNNLASAVPCSLSSLFAVFILSWVLGPLWFVVWFMEFSNQSFVENIFL